MHRPIGPLVRARQAAARRLVVLTAVAGLTLAALPGEASADAQTRRQLVRLSAQIERELRSSPEMIEAQRQLAEARRIYDAHRSSALLALEAQGELRMLRLQADDLQEKLDVIYHTYRYGVPPVDQTAPLASAIFAMRQQVTLAQRDALEQHQAAQEAKANFLAAAARVVELQRRIPDAIRADPRFRAVSPMY